MFKEECPKPFEGLQQCHPLKSNTIKDIHEKGQKYGWKREKEGNERN